MEKYPDGPLQYIEGLKTEQNWRLLAKQEGVQDLSIWAKESDLHLTQDYATKEWLRSQLTAVGATGDLPTQAWIKGLMTSDDFWAGAGGSWGGAAINAVSDVITTQMGAKTNLLSSAIQAGGAVKSAVVNTAGNVFGSIVDGVTGIFDGDDDDKDPEQSTQRFIDLIQFLNDKMLWMTAEINEIEEDLNVFKQTLETEVLKHEIKGLKPLSNPLLSAPPLEPSAPPLEESYELAPDPVKEVEEPSDIPKEESTPIQDPPVNQPPARTFDDYWVPRLKYLDGIRVERYLRPGGILDNWVGMIEDMSDQLQDIVLYNKPDAIQNRIYKTDVEGHPKTSASGNLFAEYATAEHFQSEKGISSYLTLGYATLRAVYDELPESSKDVCNIIKTFINQRPTAFFWHHGTVDGSCKFHGLHIHLVIKCTMKLCQVNQYKVLKKSGRKIRSGSQMPKGSALGGSTRSSSTGTKNQTWL